MRAPARSGAPLPVKRASQLLKSTSSWVEKAGGCQPCPGPESSTAAPGPSSLRGGDAPRSPRWMERGFGTLHPPELTRCQEEEGDTYLEVDDGHSCAVSSAHNAVEVLQP